MRVYIAGPMTGIEDYNYPAFYAMANKIRYATDWEVDNPAEHYGGRQDLPRDIYMRAAIEAVLGCDAVVLLPGWMDSEGAWVEVQVAQALSLTFFDQNLVEVVDPLAPYRSTEAIA